MGSPTPPLQTMYFFYFTLQLCRLQWQCVAIFGILFSVRSLELVRFFILLIKISNSKRKSVVIARHASFWNTVCVYFMLFYVCGSRSYIHGSVVCGSRSYIHGSVVCGSRSYIHGSVVCGLSYIHGNVGRRRQWLMLLFNVRVKKAFHSFPPPQLVEQCHELQARAGKTRSRATTGQRRQN